MPMTPELGSGMVPNMVPDTGKRVPLRVKLVFILMLLLVMSSGAVIYVETPLFYYGVVALGLVIVVVLVYFGYFLARGKPELFADSANGSNTTGHSDSGAGLQKVLEAEKDYKTRTSKKRHTGRSSKVRTKTKTKVKTKTDEKDIEKPRQKSRHKPRQEPKQKQKQKKSDDEDHVLTISGPSEDLDPRKKVKGSEEGIVEEEFEGEEGEDEEEVVKEEKEKEIKKKQKTKRRVGRKKMIGRIGTIPLEDSMMEKRYKLSGDKAEKKKSKKESKVTTFLCPECGSKELYYEAGLISGYKYHCKDCDYLGSFVIEKDFEV
jgi:predicted RNA-binding Zn-ribbon protein involved in translation (DUF1610 family)